MSKKRVTCPKCGKKIMVDVISCIHENDESAWKALLAHRLNTCVCPDCGTSFMVNEPLTYCDKNNPFILTYINDDGEEENTFELEHWFDETADEMAEREGIEKPVVRLTTTIWDFIEKIFIWRMGLDDRLIEFAKQQLFRNTDLDKLSRSQHRLLLDFSATDGEKLVFLVFDRETNQPVGRMHVPMEEFRKLTDEFQGNNQLMNELNTLFPSCIVSVDRLI